MPRTASSFSPDPNVEGVSPQDIMDSCLPLLPDHVPL